MSMYKLIVRYADGRTETWVVPTFPFLSAAIDRAWAKPGFIGYEVGPVS